ncbi:MAG: Rv3235 family protein [Nocardioidaceae bacterium]
MSFPAQRRPDGIVTRFVPIEAERLSDADLEPRAVQGTLALDLHAADAPPLRTLPGAAWTEQGDPEELRTWAGRFAQTVLEALNCDRPVTQLLRWTTPHIYRQLERRIAARQKAVRSVPRIGQRHPVVRATVRSVHVCQPGPDAVEVGVHIQTGDRSRAMAARLERRGGQWLCTALEL